MPKKTVNTIIDKGNNHVIQVKGNQKSLLNACKEISGKNTFIDNYETQEKSRGRYEIRSVKIYKPTELIPSGWQALNKVIKVERLTERDGKTEYSNSYYISSLDINIAKEFAIGIREHWSIENKLHWVKDVIQNEDKSRIKKGNGVETLSIFKNIAINICKDLGYKSIKNAGIYFASNVNELINKIRT